MTIFWLLQYEKYLMQYDASHQHLVYIHLYIPPLNIYLTAYLNSNIPVVRENSVPCTQDNHDLWKIYITRLT